LGLHKSLSVSGSNLVSSRETTANQTRRRLMMRRFWPPILVSVFLFAGIVTPANAQAARAQAHVAAAKAAASGPGENFSATFTAVCKQSKPGEQGAPTAGDPANFP